jgi:hypothetical protein
LKAIPLVSWCAADRVKLVKRNLYCANDEHAARLISFFYGIENKHFIYTASIIKAIDGEAIKYLASYIIQEWDNDKNERSQIEYFNENQIKELCHFTSLPKRIFTRSNVHMLKFSGEDITKTQIDQIFLKWRTQQISS